MDREKVKYIKEVVEDNEGYYGVESFAERICMEEWMQEEKSEDILNLVKKFEIERLTHK